MTVAPDTRPALYAKEKRPLDSFASAGELAAWLSLWDPELPVRSWSEGGRQYLLIEWEARIEDLSPENLRRFAVNLLSHDVPGELDRLRAVYGNEIFDA